MSPLIDLADVAVDEPRLSPALAHVVRRLAEKEEDPEEASAFNSAV